MNQSYFFKKLLKNYLSINPDYNNLYKEKHHYLLKYFKKKRPEAKNSKVSRKFLNLNLKLLILNQKINIKNINTIYFYSNPNKIFKNKYKNLIENLKITNLFKKFRTNLSKWYNTV
uniref:Uncharacterized protein n=1 Tax=Candidatus Phytoplasma australasiaticum subsp. australasiaticum TaxID=2832407 RepID=A0A7S7JMR2_9MOLU|nr:hypothetical protein H7685_02700 ['Parthenium hysterophorus' phyllody phytoplasma]